MSRHEYEASREIELTRDARKAIGGAAAKLYKEAQRSRVGDR